MNTNRNLLMSIDVEPDIYTLRYRGVSEGLLIASRIFRKHNIKATLFTTCDCIQKYPKIFNTLQKEGHEIALHGYRHVRFDHLSYAEKEEQIKKSLKVFKKYLKSKPLGFRAPQCAKDKGTIKLLKKYNFEYDSSLIPWNLHHILYPQVEIKFSDNFQKMRPHKIDGVQEIPITSFVLPFSALTIRFLPFPLFKIYLKLVNLFRNKVFIMHSWDFIELKDSKMYRRCPLPVFLRRFDYVLGHFKRSKGVTLLDYSRQLNKGKSK